MANAQQTTAPDSPCWDTPHQGAFQFLSCLWGLNGGGGEYRAEINQVELINTLAEALGKDTAWPC